MEKNRKFRSSPCMVEPNYMMLPVNKVSTIEEFNEIYFYWKRMEKKGLVRWGIKRTQSGGISLKGFKPNVYEVTTNANLGCELVVIAIDEEFQPANYRVQYTSARSEWHLCGTRAYDYFVQELKRDGIDIKDYFRDDGIEFKKKIEKPIIDVANIAFLDLTFENVHHLDIRASYPAGMAEFIPEWRPAIERLYYSRNSRPINKDILNMACGYFQSPKGRVKNRLAHVSEYAIRRNNQKVRDMANWLRANGRTVIMFNTDGIWFAGEPTGLNSTKLGEWREDHKNCKFRAKSKGAYEYIEDGVYTPVVRGLTKLDRVKNRADWQWGDIYSDNAEPVQLEFSREKGIHFSEDGVKFKQWR